MHTNSGVGNRTFYLISQGGKQGGQTVHGIDGPSLKKSATLYLDVIQHLVSGSDYADLAAVLDQQLSRPGPPPHGRDDRRRTAATSTGPRSRPGCAPRRRARSSRRTRRWPARGATGPVRVLFDSEKGKPRSKFDAGSAWLRAPNLSAFPPVAANATSGHTLVVLQRPAGLHGQLADACIRSRLPAGRAGVPVVPAVAGASTPPRTPRATR